MIDIGSAAEDVHVLTLEHESSAENAEDRARGADGEALWREEECAGRPGQACDDVEQQIAAAAEHLLDGGAEPPEREHVQSEVDRPVVEEHGADEPPVVPVGDQRPVEDALPVDLVAGAVDLPAEGELQEVDAHVDPDQRLRDESAWSPRSSLGAPLRDAGGALCHARVIGARIPTGAKVMQSSTDRPAALRAGNERLPVGMAAAVHRFGGAAKGAAVA